MEPLVGLLRGKSFLRWGRKEGFWEEMTFEIESQRRNNRWGKNVPDDAKEGNVKNKVWGFESKEVRNGAGEGPGPKGPCQESSKFILRAVGSH